MTRPSAPRLKIVLIVFSTSFCSEKFSRLISLSTHLSMSESVLISSRTHLGEKLISVILILEPVIRKDLLSA